MDQGRGEIRGRGEIGIVREGTPGPGHRANPEAALPREEGDVAAYGGKKRPEDIERDIEHTRAEMSETIDEIQDRFRPERIKEQVKDSAKRTVKEAGSSMIETIKNNPLPAIIAGLSLGWMFTRGSDGNGYEDGRGSYGGATNRQRAGRGVPSRSASYSRETEGEESIGDRAGEMASRARESVSEFGEHAWEGVEHLGEGARHQVTRATNRFEEVLDESPLAAGAIALAAGAAVGLAIPLTRREDEFMGETRDHLVHQVQHKAEETWEKAKRVGEKTMEEAERTAKEEAERQKIA